MKKVNSVKDITSGMLVTLRNGKKMTVVTTTVYGNMDKCCTVLALFAPGGSEDDTDDYWPLSEYSDDFKYKFNMFPVVFRAKSRTFPLLIDETWGDVNVSISEYDIVQVWSCTCPSNAFANTTEDRVLLWSDPSYEAKTWDELTEEEKDAECGKYEDCRDCPYNNKGCDDYDYRIPKDEPEEEPEKGAPDVAFQLDELRKLCKDDPIGSLVFKVFGGDLPDEYADYILGKSDKNPVRKAPTFGDKSLAEMLYESDKELAADGVSIVERDIALLAAMRSAFGDSKE